MARGLSELQREILKMIRETESIQRWRLYFSIKEVYFKFEKVSPNAYRFKANPNDPKARASICRAIARLKKRGLIDVEGIQIKLTELGNDLFKKSNG